MQQRRRRNVRQPRGHSLELTPLKVSILQKLNHYYDLPTSFICALHPEGSDQYIGQLLRKMYEENNPFKQPLLARDDMYGDHFSKQEVHMLGPGGKLASKALGLEAHTLGTGALKYHEKMLIACSASIEIGCLQNGRTFHHTTALINREDTPAAVKVAAKPRRVKLDDKRALVVDDLFAIGYPEGFLYFAVEVDTGTEQLEKRRKYSSIEQKMEYAKAFYARRLYKSHYGLPSLFTLFITVGESRMKRMMELAAKAGVGNSTLFTFIPDYAKKYVPYKPAPQLLTQTWYRGNGQPFSLLVGKDA